MIIRAYRHSTPEILIPLFVQAYHPVHLEFQLAYTVGPEKAVAARIAWLNAGQPGILA